MKTLGVYHTAAHAGTSDGKTRPPTPQGCSIHRPGAWCKSFYHHPRLLFSGTSPPVLLAAWHVIR